MPQHPESGNQFQPGLVVSVVVAFSSPCENPDKETERERACKAQSTLRGRVKRMLVSPIYPP